MKIPITTETFKRGEPDDTYNATAATNSDQNPILSGNETMSYGGGPLLQNVEFIPIYYGSEWNNGNFSDIKKQMEAFNGMFVQSEVLSEIGKQYSTPNQTIGLGTTLPSINQNATAAGLSIDDSQLQRFLLKGIADGTLPAKNNNSLYAFFTPPGTEVTFKAVNETSGVNYCGYHDNVNDTPYAVLPYPSAIGCGSDIFNITAQKNIDILTEVTSHEFIEAVTDPQPRSGWSVPGNGTHGGAEIGDLCAWQPQVVNGSIAQQMYNPYTNACEVVPGAALPAPSPTPSVTALPTFSSASTSPVPTFSSVSTSPVPTFSPVSSGAEKTVMGADSSLKALALAACVLQTQTAQDVLFNNPFSKIAKWTYDKIAAEYSSRIGNNTGISEEKMSLLPSAASEKSLTR